MDRIHRIPERRDTDFLTAKCAKNANKADFTEVREGDEDF
jgi:hypothetical protein